MNRVDDTLNLDSYVRMTKQIVSYYKNLLTYRPVFISIKELFLEDEQSEL